MTGWELGKREEALTRFCCSDILPLIVIRVGRERDLPSGFPAVLRLDPLRLERHDLVAHPLHNAPLNTKQEIEKARIEAITGSNPFLDGPGEAACYRS